MTEIPDLTSDPKLVHIRDERDRYQQWKDEIAKLTWCRCKRDKDSRQVVHELCDPFGSLSAAASRAKELSLKSSPELANHLRKCFAKNECPLKVENESVPVPEAANGWNWDEDGFDNWVRKVLVEEGPGPVQADEVRDVPEIFYDGKTHNWLMLDSHGRYQSMSTEQAAATLNECGLSSRRDKDGSLSEIEKVLEKNRRINPVDWWGDLAGHRSGLLEFAGRRILIKSGFQLIEPVPGEWPLISSILTQLLGETQLPYFHAEMKLGYESLQAGSTRPGHLIVLCGPRDGTKSLVQHSIITFVLGGRSADAARYLTGRTEFNSDLAGAEHVFLDDAKPYTNWLSRHDFSENLKGFIVGKVVSVHGKNRDAINLPVRWRVSMSINDDETALRSMPDVSESFADKAHLFRTGVVKLPMPNETLEERTAMDKALAGELPHYIEWLLRWEIPDHMRGTRFGCVHYHNPELLALLAEISDEARLLEIIDSAGLPPRNHPDLEKAGITFGEVWYGTAEELHEALLEERAVRRQAEQILSWRNATGTLLGRLAKSNPDRCVPWRHKVNQKDVRHWVIVRQQSGRRTRRSIPRDDGELV